MKEKIYNTLNHLFDYLRVKKNNLRSIRFPYRKDYSGSIYVMGNGPSLKSSLANILSSNTSNYFFAVNDFAVSDAFERIKPNFYIMVDHCYWSKAEDTNSKDLELRTKVFSKLIENTDWEMKVFIPDYAYKQGSFSHLLKNPNLVLTPFNRYSIKAENSKFYYNNLKANNTAYFNNVLANAIYCSLNLGFDELYVLGAEHSWTKDIRVNELNQVCTIKEHFFEKNSELIPWQRSDGQIFTMTEVLSALSHHFQAYELLNQYANQLGAKIFNSTPGSFIDAFERRLAK